MSNSDPMQDVFSKRCQKIKRRFLREPTDFELFALRVFPLPPASQPHLTTPDGVKIKCPSEARRLLTFCELEEDITGLHEAGSLLEVLQYREESAPVGDPSAPPPLCSWHTTSSAVASTPTPMKQPMFSGNRFVEKTKFTDTNTHNVSSDGQDDEWKSSVYPDPTDRPVTPRRLPPAYDFSLTPSTGIEDCARPTPPSTRSDRNVATPLSSKRAYSPRNSDSDSSPTKNRRGRSVGKLNRKTVKKYKETEVGPETQSTETNLIKSSRRGSTAVKPNRAQAVGGSIPQRNQLFGKYFNELAQNLDIRDQAEVHAQYPTHQSHTGRPESFYDSPINNKVQVETQTQYTTQQSYDGPMHSYNENRLGVGHLQPALGLAGGHDQVLPGYPTDDAQSHANYDDHLVLQSNDSYYNQFHVQLEAETNPNYQFTYPEPDEDHSRRVEQSMQAVHEQYEVHRRDLSGAEDLTGPGCSLLSDIVQTPPHRHLGATITNIPSESMTSSALESSRNKSFREHRFRQHGSSICAGCRRNCSLKGSTPVPAQPLRFPFKQHRSRSNSTAQSTKPNVPASSIQRKESDSQQPHPTAVAFQARLLERLNTNIAPVPEVFTRNPKTDLQQPHPTAVAFQGRLLERLKAPTENVPEFFTHQAEPDSQEPHPTVIAYQARLRELNAHPAPLPPGLFLPPPHISPSTHRYAAARNAAIKSYQRGEPVQPRKNPALAMAPLAPASRTDPHPIPAFHQPPTTNKHLDASFKMIRTAGAQPAYSDSGSSSSLDPAPFARSYSQFFADPITESEWRRSAETAAVTAPKGTAKATWKGKAGNE
ncbi:hypothetical protein JHW43_001682 [Diplocarpon mali]|nr:hypothetical protein JHW43_001682 [Diplocarpon mali]